MAYNPQYDGGNQQYSTSMPMQQGGYSQQGGYPNMPMAPQDQNTMMQQQPQPYMGGVPQQQPRPYMGGVPQQQQQQVYMQQPQQMLMLAVDEGEVRASVFGTGLSLWRVSSISIGTSWDVPFATTVLNMIVMAGFLVMMLVFRCSRCISDLHWGQFRRSCGTLIMISVLGSLAGIALLALIVALGVYAYRCAILPTGALYYFPIIYYSFSVISVLTGFIQILVGYCGLAPKQDEETTLLI
ncbi:unnamed protein product [Amoebophrya sp. A25]|nr:unnamed protein product [Amoebophrya sp. A25]|eukprot:GSA25T00019393001.1